MARLTEPRRQQRRERILEAARQVFESRGYDAATVAEIATQVGIVEGTIFHHFGSKRALLVRVMEGFYRDITAAKRRGLAGVDGTAERLRFLIRFHLRVFADNAALCGAILRASRGADGDLKRDIQALNRAYTAPLKDVVEAGVGCGDLRADVDVGLLRNTIYGSVEHMLWSVLYDGHVVDVDRTAAALSALVLGGIQQRQPDTLAPADREELRRLVGRVSAIVDKRGSAAAPNE